MKLIVEWINATRPKEQKTLVELTARDSILEFMNGVENAYKAREIFRRCRQPLSDWNRAVNFAYFYAMKGLTPNEKSIAKLKIDFDL